MFSLPGVHPESCSPMVMTQSDNLLKFRRRFADTFEKLVASLPQRVRDGRKAGETMQRRLGEVDWDGA